MGISVSSTIYLNAAAIGKLTDIAVKALEMTADATMGQIKNTQVMPFDTGTLQNDSTFVDTSQSKNGIVRIVSSTPYARRLYFHPEYNFQHTYNAFAGAGWFRFWSAGGSRQDFIPKTFAIHFKELMK
ncbi:MAG: hypothetical protein Q3989_05910 [Eubacteriales bacterium]|jgi:hypothetical protein|nr:hypothetical protein [Eubacteriales bacterium]